MSEVEYPIHEYVNEMAQHSHKITAPEFAMDRLIKYENEGLYPALQVEAEALRSQGFYVQMAEHLPDEAGTQWVQFLLISPNTLAEIRGYDLP